MLKNKIKIIAVFLILIILLGTTLVYADNETINNTNEEIKGTSPISNNAEEIDIPNETTTSNAILQEDNYKKNDVYLNGKDITIDYIIDGNLFVFADTVTINSQIGGDAFIFARNVIIEEKGYIFSNLFTISNSVEIKGVVYDIYALSRNITISKGYVYRDLKAVCDTLNINGTVGRNVFIQCSNINFNTDNQNKGIIYGNLDYISDSEISIPENVVTGKINYSQIKDSSKISIQSIILDLGSFITFVLIIWLLCLWLTPKFLKNTESYVGIKSLLILGCGVLALLAIPIACIILLLLKLTSAFSLLLLVIYLLAILISKSLFTITANNYICSKLKINKNLAIFGMLIISAIVIWLITFIPYVGGILSFIITVLGLGILVYSIFPKKINNNETTISEKTKK